MKKKLLATALVLLLTIAAGCGGTPAQSSSAPPAQSAAPAATSQAAAASTAPAEPENTEPVRLTAQAKYSSLYPSLDTTSIWAHVLEKLNLEVSVTLLNDDEKVNLMFASRDFPDFGMNLGGGFSAAAMANAAEAGDIVALDDLLPEHAPTWDKFLKENPLAANGIRNSDGKIYTLPYIDFAPYDRDLRDQWIITDSWLKELNLEIPTTTEEFVTVLRAFKDNAGKGSIPAEVIPFFYFFDNYIGGQFDVYGSFGVLVQNAEYLTVQNGTVVCQAINPDIKEPLKFLRDLYAEGLTPPECFTDDWATYLTKISSDPPVVGSYGSYANRLPAQQTPMPPLDSGNGKQPLMRKQAYTANVGKAFVIFKDNPDYAATLRLAEYAATPEGTMHINTGKQGVVWDYNSNNQAYRIFWEESPDLMSANAGDLGLHNSFTGLRDSNFYDSFYYEQTMETERSRAWAFYEIYQPFVPQGDVVYVSAVLDAESEDEIKLLQTDLTDLRKTTFANWITGKGDIDAEWDKFVADMESRNLAKWLEYKQQAYDLMIK